MAWYAIPLAALSFVWQIFAEWLAILAAPIFNTELLWISIPIWASWFFAEFFQEKRGTSFGNAISNGVIPLFVGIDWARFITNQVAAQGFYDLWLVVVKYVFCGAVALYGIIIIVSGILGHSFVRHAGRIREVTYVLLILTPVVYGVFDLSWLLVIEAVVFFPLWYYVIEWIDRKLPDPKIYQMDEMPEQLVQQRMPQRVPQQYSQYYPFYQRRYR